MLKKLSVTIALLGALTVTAVARPALADVSFYGPLTQVEYNADNGQLLLQLNGDTSVNYLVQQVSPGCGLAANSFDTIKMFLSTAQAALLAGKNVTLYAHYASCHLNIYIYDITLQK